MANVEVKADPQSERVAIFALVGLPLAIFASWWMPRAATPTELPALVLPHAEVEQALAVDEALAARAPSGRAEEERRALYLEEGRHEIRGDDSAYDAAVRAERLAALLAALEEESGEEAVAAARMADVLRIERAIAGEGTPTERAGEAGLFVQALERWRAVVDGRRVAPPIVVRALAIARWNAVFSRELTEGLSPVHVRAYHGWLALHGTSGWTDLRALALDHYEEAGGQRTLEARGVLALDEGEPQMAEALFTRAYERVGSIRLRNLALAAVERGAGDEPD